MINKSLFSAIALLLLISFSCKKSDSDIGREILPQADILGATYCDTATIVCYTVPDDSIRTDESYIGSVANIIGSIADPVFGRTDASVYINLSNPNNTTNIGFGTNPKLDSVVLSLAYQRGLYYGDLNDALTFNIYRLTSPIYYDSSYYSYSTVPYDALNDITYTGNGKNVLIAPSTEVYDGDTKYSPHLRIRLKNEIGQEFIDDTTKLANTEALRNAFKGLYITTKNSAVSGNDYGAFGYFDFSNPLSRMTIYYHNGTDFTTKRIDLSLYGANAHFNHYDHDRTNADPVYTQQLNGSNLSNGNNYLFLQGMANSKIRIEFPYLKNFSDSGKIAINRAEIAFKVDKSAAYYNTNLYFIPAKMALEGLYDGTTLFGLSLDQTYNLAGNWGDYNSNTSEFSFPISFTAQKIANGEYTNVSYSMRLFQHQVNPGRVVLGGRDNSTYPAKLKLWYTRVK